MYEKRLTVRLVNYWDNLRKEAAQPTFATWNPAAIDDIWQNCMALQVLPSAANTNTKTYTYVHCGEEVAQAVGKNLLGETLTTKMKFFPGARIIRRIDDVANMHSPVPVYDEGEFVNDKSQIVKYRACLVSFMARDSFVSHVVVGVSWRAF